MLFLVRLAVALNCLWWDSLEDAYLAGRALWRLFVGEKPCPTSNRQYAQFIKLLLEGKSLKANV